MKLEIHLGGKARIVELSRSEGRLTWAIDGQAIDADAVEITPGIFSILLDGRSFEVRVDAHAGGLRIHTGHREYPVTVIDPRSWRGKRGHALEAAGRQQIVAPMPGKVVRLLVQQGDAIEAGKGLLVVEAMKMQNEIRAPKSGTVERLLVSEGQPVNAGEVLAVVS
ncbi:MAG: biotin/lipoyl-containing protein [Candidatus Acidiferrales bacterium]